MLSKVLERETNSWRDVMKVIKKMCLTKGSKLLRTSADISNVIAWFSKISGGGGK